jgi:hypothetical protein
MVTTLVFKEKRIFSAENWAKLLKIVITTLFFKSPFFAQNLGEIAETNGHDIDPPGRAVRGPDGELHDGSGILDPAGMAPLPRIALTSPGKLRTIFTEKSEAIASARRCRSSWLTRW